MIPVAIKIIVHTAYNNTYVIIVVFSQYWTLKTIHLDIPKWS